MKKVLYLVFCLFLLLGVAGCGEEEKSDNKKNDVNENNVKNEDVIESEKVVKEETYLCEQTDDEYFFRVSSDAAIYLESYPGDNSLSDSVNDAGEIIYVVKGKKLEYDKCKSYSRDSYFYNYDDERKCEKLNAHYEKYEKIIEDVIDEREDLYDEVGKELVWREW